MSKQGTVRHMFPGASTPSGFYSLYDHIAPVAARRIFVIKGGPGVGKSTFMRKIGEDLLSRGFDLEFHHCSADNNSLDGVYIPGIEVALLDGTAPHVVDPKNPGAVDEIIHLGDYWDEAGIREPANKEAILRTNAECGFRFKRATDALKAAKDCYEEWKSYYTACLDISGLNGLTEDLAESLLSERTGYPGMARRLFASAITYDGPRHWLPNLFDHAARRYVIKGEPGTGKSTLAGRLAATAVARGYTLDAFHCPMYPERINHFYIREAGIGVITSTWPHEYTPQPCDIVVSTDDFVDKKKLAAYTEEIAAAKAAFFESIRRETHHLGVAKKIHDEMERYYIPHMNFAAIEERRQKTLKRILELASEAGAL